MFRVLLIACCLSSFPVLADSAAAIGGLVNQRLSFMKDVAGYKAQQHLPIEDVTQEAKVLAVSEAEAERLGLVSTSVRPLIVAQMDAAKAIQYRYRADWLATPEPGWQPRPLDSVRSQIAQLSSRILQQLVKQLRTGPLTDADRGDFLRTVNQVNLSDADKQRLFDALLVVKVGKTGC
ncbi:chorismate mutase [Serratia symbiotica]|uniref:Chorismate mutase n=1 Tax=Serratia symbiotica SCt-VLC TaxID=1347341 RepID=A0A068RDB8_9GAMM|nr:chorismate mutase [Serratia symbiotica]CDG48784.1 Chorismate mutase type II domain-containing protein [Serratia symbiotica SCt-VLC]